MLKKRKIEYLGLIVYVFGVMFSDMGIFFYACTLFFLGCQYLSKSSRFRGKINYFIVVYSFFIIYLLFNTVIGNTFVPSVSYKRCFVMTLNLIINYLIMSMLTDDCMRKRFLYDFPKLAIIFEIYIFVFSGKDLLTGRLSGSNLPIPLKLNANGIALIFLISFLLEYYHYLEDKKKYHIGTICLFVIGIILSGSRKSLISMPILFLAIPIMHTYINDKKNIGKIIKFVFIGIVTILIALLLITKIPALYNIAGQRLFAFFSGMDASGMYDESSLNYRYRFVELAKAYFYQHPIVGIGIDNFAQVNFIKGYYAHNDYWEILTGSGIIGGIMYYSTYLYLIIQLIKNIKLQDAGIFLLYVLILILLNNYMVTYLERICILFLFISNSVFLHSDLKTLQEMEHEVHCATDEEYNNNGIEVN